MIPPLLLPDVPSSTGLPPRLRSCLLGASLS
jgi:hypothetical protein